MRFFSWKTPRVLAWFHGPQQKFGFWRKQHSIDWKLYSILRFLTNFHFWTWLFLLQIILKRLVKYWVHEILEFELSTTIQKHAYSRLGVFIPSTENNNCISQRNRCMVIRPWNSWYLRKKCMKISYIPLIAIQWILPSFFLLPFVGCEIEHFHPFVIWISFQFSNFAKTLFGAVLT